MKICIDLRFKKNEEGKLILQARWQPLQFSGTYALQLSGEPTDWENVESADQVLAPEELAKYEFLADPVEEAKSESISSAEKEAINKYQALKKAKNSEPKNIRDEI